MPLDLVLRLAGSLAAILFLFWLAGRMGLGGDVRIADEDEARALAAEAVYGFDAVEVALDKAGIGALLRDADGRQMLLRRHGARFVGRILDTGIEARLDRDFLMIDTRERGFGGVTLHLGEAAQHWAAGFRRLAAEAA